MKEMSRQSNSPVGILISVGSHTFYIRLKSVPLTIVAYP